MEERLFTLLAKQHFNGVVQKSTGKTRNFS